MRASSRAGPSSSDDPDALVFGTATGKPQSPSNVRGRVLAKAVERGSDRLTEAGEAPLPSLTPHGLRRTFASVMYAIGEDPGAVMDDLGHTDPKLAMTVYRQSMRRDEGERDRLRALVEGARIGSDGSEAASEPATDGMERAQ
jgi:integrase